ncbi:hypothetical protein [Streptomyces sp. NRRL F-5630]
MPALPIHRDPARGDRVALPPDAALTTVAGRLGIPAAHPVTT